MGPKPKINGFSLFAQEKGFTGMRMRLAGPLWEAMEQREKDVYHERARVQREANRAAAPAAAPPQASGGPAATPGPSGSSSVAPPPSKRARREEAARVQRTAFWEAIKEKTASLVGKALADGKLLDTTFVIFNAITYCRDEANEEDKAVHYPGEIAAVGFSLRNGVSPKFEDLIIDPVNSIPEAYRFGMSAWMDARDANLSKMWTSDYAAVLGKIVKFINSEDVANGLFVQRKDYWTALKSLEFLAGNGGWSVFNVPVLVLEDLFTQLKFAAAQMNPSLGVPDISGMALRRILDNTRYDFLKDQTCAYHADKYEDISGGVTRCPLGHCRIKAYLLLNNVCTDMGIPKVPGAHVPV